MSATGWVRLYRQALENGWLRNPTLWAFWCYCLLKATHAPITVTVGYQRVVLEPGQFVFGRKQAAADLGLTENVVRTCLIRLISTGNLTINPTNKFSVITIVNWAAYQNEHEGHHQQSNHQNNQELTNNSPTTHHIQELKEVKEKKSSFTDTFAVFWKEYPRKVAKAAALKAWKKLRPSEVLVTQILAALQQQKESDNWLKDGGKFIPHPATWLNGGRWEDEEPSFTGPTSHPQERLTRAQLEEVL